MTQKRRVKKMLQLFVVPLEWVVYPTMETVAAGPQNHINQKMTSTFMYMNVNVHEKSSKCSHTGN